MQAFRSSFVPPTFLKYRKQERAHAIVRNDWRAKKRWQSLTSVLLTSF